VSEPRPTDATPGDGPEGRASQVDERRSRFASRFARLTDGDIRCLASWTAAVQEGRPGSGREWRAAAWRELNSVGDHPAAVAYRGSIRSAVALLRDDVRSIASLDDLVEELGEAAQREGLDLRLEWQGKRRSAWSLGLGLVALIACLAFLAAAAGTGFGGRRDLMAILALVAFGLAALGFVPYVAMPLLAPTDREARAALNVAVVAVALGERLPPADYERLVEPWRMAIEPVPVVEPPRRWRTAVAAGRLMVAAITFGAIAFLSIGFLQQV